eukprot:TRINITY_DN367_c1_g1_i9.p1 TRINITY_DN367_c1_g1~~TRINITY_DN367_c1_g1_i9.p1  ORF type:complete len:311 (+),score=-10.68 TRINITY_DN367_c1_g1_i9:135-1067(+)
MKTGGAGSPPAPVFVSPVSSCQSDEAFPEMRRQQWRRRGRCPGAGASTKPCRLAELCFVSVPIPKVCVAPTLKCGGRGRIPRTKTPPPQAPRETPRDTAGPKRQEQHTPSTPAATPSAHRNPRTGKAPASHQHPAGRGQCSQRGHQRQGHRRRGQHPSWDPERDHRSETPEARAPPPAAQQGAGLRPQRAHQHSSRDQGQPRDHQRGRPPRGGVSGGGVPAPGFSGDAALGPCWGVGGLARVVSLSPARPPRTTRTPPSEATSKALEQATASSQHPSDAQIWLVSSLQPVATPEMPLCSTCFADLLHRPH